MSIDDQIVANENDNFVSSNFKIKILNNKKNKLLELLNIQFDYDHHISIIKIFSSSNRVCSIFYVA